MSEQTAHTGAQDKIRVYGHTTCPMVPPVLNLLSRSKIAYDYVNIRKDADGMHRVQQINNGNASVPTLVFPDGSTLTEPSTGVLREKLESLGHHVPTTVWLASTVLANLPLLIVGLVVLYVLIDVLF